MQLFLLCAGVESLDASFHRTSHACFNMFHQIIVELFQVCRTFSLVSRPWRSRLSHRVLFEEDSMRREALDESGRVGLEVGARVLPTLLRRTIVKRQRCDTRAAAAQDVQWKQPKQPKIRRRRRKTHVEEKTGKEAEGNAGEEWETSRA